MGMIDNIKHAFNTIAGNKDPTGNYHQGSSQRPDRYRSYNYRDKTIVSSICTRFALDVSTRAFNQVQLDSEERLVKVLKTPLNNCLTFRANKDQSGQELLYDAVYSMLEEGCIGILPIETTLDPKFSESYSIGTMRVCKIIEWFPDDIRIQVYNDIDGSMIQRVVPKKIVAICENPFSTIMNIPNSTGQRLSRKLSILDSIDEQSGSGKLDLIIQLPYSLKSTIQKDRAEERRKAMELQLTGTKYGIAYADATEKITQLNRPVENNLMKQIEYLTSQYLSQLGITQGILDGTANATTMQNYQYRIVKILANTITSAMNRSFISKTSRTQGKVVKSYFNPFELIPIETLMNMSGTLTASKILEPEDIRDMLGKKVLPVTQNEQVIPEEEYQEEEE